MTAFKRSTNRAVERLQPSQQPISADALATLRVMRGTGYGPELAAVIVAAAGLGSREARANGRA